MNRLFVGLTATMAMAGLILAGCSQPAPAPTPTKAPAAPTRAAEPTKAPAAAPTKAPAVQPTAVPAAKVDFPEKGKAVTVIVPYAAGGSTDVSARLTAAGMEKELGIPVQVVNKPGAGAQVGLTELAMAKPDGYTLGVMGMPAVITTYLDPERKAVYNRKSFEPVARSTADPIALAVKADSPYKTMKDLIDAAKASPDKIKGSASGILGALHITLLLLEKQNNVKFAVVQFNSGGEGLTAMLGGHVDVSANTLSELVPQFKAGAIRILGIADSEESKFTPGVKTMESQGYKIYMTSSHTMAAPGGTPKPIVDILSQAVKKALESSEAKSKLEAVGLKDRYLDSAQFGAYWDQSEAEITPLMQLGKQK